MGKTKERNASGVRCRSNHGTTEETWYGTKESALALLFLPTSHYFLPLMVLLVLRMIFYIFHYFYNCTGIIRAIIVRHISKIWHYDLNP